MTPEQETISILVHDETQFTRRGEERGLSSVTLKVSEVNRKFKDFLSGLEAAINIETASVGPFQLDEIQFNAEITIEGEFKLLGAGVGGSALNGVTFILKRK